MRDKKFSSVGTDLTKDVFNGKLYKTNIRSIEHISVHCSDSPQGRGDDANTIDEWHKQRWGSGIGYHFVVLEDGTIQKGRWTDAIPAAVKGHNSRNIAICFIGDGKPTKEQVKALKTLAQLLVVQYHLQQDDIKGHKEFKGHESRGCPCGLDIEDIKK